MPLFCATGTIPTTSMIYILIPAFIVCIILLVGLIAIARQMHQLYQYKRLYISLAESIDLKGELTLNQFQVLCGHTDKYKRSERLVCTSLGLASEAGEVAGKVDKWIRKNHNFEPSPEFSHEIALEVFDVLWFSSRLLHSLGYTFQDAAQDGLAKLRSRDQRGKIADLQGGDHR